MAKINTVKTAKTSFRRRLHRHAKLAFVPHAHNQYRPHAIRRYGIVVILVIVVGVQAVYNGFSTGNILSAQVQISAAGLLEATNQARAEEGEPALKVNAELTKAANLKVANMFTEQYWAHTAPDGTTPWHWFQEADYHYAEAGENLAKNFTTSESTVAAWLASPTHRANLLHKEYVDVGFAVRDGMLNGKATTLVVALYGAPDTATIQGASSQKAEASATNVPISMMARLGLGLQALTPAAISSVVLLLVAANVALLAHLYRRKLPISLRRSWYRHHGLYKAVGFVSVATIVVVVYGGAGQI
ncbi:MAG: CAP domain-containing protein [Candidatus Saccharimonas sp.]